MDSLIQFISDYWVAILSILIPLLVLNVVIRSIKSLIALAIVVAVVLIFGFNYTPEEVNELRKEATAEITKFVTATIIPIVESELNEATYVAHEDGSYDIKTTSVTIIGKKGSDQATIQYKDATYTFSAAALGTKIQAFINEHNEK